MQSYAGAAQKAEASVAVLEAKVAALQFKEQEAAAVPSTAQVAATIHLCLSYLKQSITPDMSYIYVYIYEVAQHK